jgi:arabinose-5-phosphate isomerase
MGDALAVTLMEARGFKPENFARFHPGGSLGRRLLSRVEHEMTSSNLPVVNSTAGVMEVIQAITRSNLGLTLVDAKPDLGIITDGDLRRAVEEHGTQVFGLQARDLMTCNPVRIKVGTRVEDALSLLERRQITAVLVYDGDALAGIFKK